MTNPCLYCHKPVTDDIKRLPTLDGFGRVTEKLVHRACHERLVAYSVGVEPVEYHCQCRICREAFWNYEPPTRKRDIERLKRWRREG